MGGYRQTKNQTHKMADGVSHSSTTEAVLRDGTSLCWEVTSGDKSADGFKCIQMSVSAETDCTAQQTPRKQSLKEPASRSSRPSVRAGKNRHPGCPGAQRPDHLCLLGTLADQAPSQHLSLGIIGCFPPSLASALQRSLGRKCQGLMT